MKLTQIALPFVTPGGILEHGKFLQFQIRKNELIFVNWKNFEFLNFLESDDI